MNGKFGALAFELRFPDGNWVRLYLNGRSEGLPEGTVMVNWAVQHLYYLQSQPGCECLGLDSLMLSMMSEELPPNELRLARSNNDALRHDDEGFRTSLRPEGPGPL